MASALVAASFALSPMHLSALLNLRDYSKAPFFAISLLACGLAARRRLTIVQTLGLAAVTGAVLGLGFGMRTDVIAYLPVVVVTLLLFVPGAMVRSWPMRLGGPLVCLTTFFVTAWPIIAVHAGGNTWHWAILGLSHEFDSALGIERGHTASTISISTVLSRRS